MTSLTWKRQNIERCSGAAEAKVHDARPSKIACINVLAIIMMTASFSSWSQSQEGAELSDTLANASEERHDERLFSGVGNKLEAAGITPHFWLWSLRVENPSTGPREGEYAITNNIFTGADFDLETIAGITDATFHLEYIFFPGNKNVGQPTGPAYAGAAGSYFGGSPARNDISTGYLSQFSLEQHHFDGQLRTVVGRTNARRYFFENNCSNIVTCNDPIWDNATGSLPSPYASWGAFGQLNIGNHRSVKLGVFESDPQQYLEQKHGFDWDLSDSAGETILAAIGRQTTFADEVYPGRYELIGFYNTSDQSDPRTGQHDGSGTAGAMFKFRQAVWRPDGGIEKMSNPESLFWFGSIETAPGNNQPYQGFVETGLTYLNPFRRSGDMANIKASYVHVGSRQLEAQRMARMTNGGTSEYGSRHVYRIEANYHLALPGYIFVQPSVQYIINPSNFYNPSAPELSDNGFVVALQFGIDLGKALGLTAPH